MGAPSPLQSRSQIQLHHQFLVLDFLGVSWQLIQGERRKRTLATASVTEERSTIILRREKRSVFAMAMVPQLVTMLLHMNPLMTMAHPWHQFMEHPQEAATAARNAIVEPSIPNLKSKRRRTRSVTAFVMDMGLLLLAMVLPPTITRLHQLDTGLQLRVMELPSRAMPLLMTPMVFQKQVTGPLHRVTVLLHPAMVLLHLFVLATEHLDHIRRRKKKRTRAVIAVDTQHMNMVLQQFHTNPQHQHIMHLHIQLPPTMLLLITPPHTIPVTDEPSAHTKTRKKTRVKPPDSLGYNLI